MFIVAIFLIVWGFMFGCMPLIFMLNDGIPFLEILPFISIFLVIGLAAIMFGFIIIIKQVYLGFVKKNGIETTGHFISKGTSLIKNRIPYYYIIFSYITENGEEKEFKTSSIYTAEKAFYYEKLGTFSVKYLGRTAVITEKLSYEKLAKFQNNQETKQTTNWQSKETNYEYSNEVDKNTEPPTYYTCEYCGGTNTTPGRCPNCGARLKKKDK